MPPSPVPSPIYVQMIGTGEGAPWWGVPVIAGAFLIIGGALGFYFNWVIENRKAKAALRNRFIDQILETCAKILTHSTELRRFSVHLGAHLLALERGKVLEGDDDDERVQHEESMIGPTSIREAGRSLKEAAIDLGWRHLKTSSDVTESIELFVQRREEFENAVRRLFRSNSAG
jgi:hypothetical protein